MLQWLSFSARPLRLEELAEIVAIDIDKTPRFDPERRWPNPQDILTICSSLVTLTTDLYDANEEDNSSGFVKALQRHVFDMERASTTYIRLAHFSVKEYLISDRIQHEIAARYSVREIESHGVLAEDCIAYLLQFDTPNSLTSKTLESSPLARYAAEHWTDHARQAQKGPVKSAASLSIELLMSGEGGFLNWVRIANLDLYNRENLSRGIGDVAPPLYYASLAGLSEPVNMMIEKKVDVNVKCGYYGNSLQAASFSRYTGIAQILIDMGAEIDAMGRFGSALCAFCHAGNYEIVELLLNRGADLDAYGEGESDNGTALQIASGLGYENIVKLLLGRDADVNGTSNLERRSPLERASLRGYENIVKMLLDKGADVNTQRDSRGALQCASSHGHENVVKILLDRGADVNAQGDWMSALQLASEEGHENVMRMLLEKGVDVNAKGKKGNALQLASRWGYENIVKMLLDRGADVNATSPGARQNALQLASFWGKESIVKILLERGAVIPEGEIETSEEEWETSEDESKRMKMNMETWKAIKMSIRLSKTSKTPNLVLHQR